jgi:putative membrane protein
MMWYGDGSSWAGWLVMSLMMLIFWGGLIGLVVWLVRQPRREGGDEKPPDRSPDKSPTTILEERFARGDIDEEEFQKRRTTLLQASGTK